MNPAESPPVLVGDRGDLDRPCGYRRPDDGVRIFHHQERSARRPLDIERTEALQLGRRRSNPKRRLSHLQLRHDVIAFAHKMNNHCAERSLIKGQRLAGTVNPELRLDARHCSIFAVCRPSGTASGTAPGWRSARSFDSSRAGTRSSMTEPRQPGKVLAGREAGTPFRALNRVALVVAVAFLFVFAIAFTLWETLR